MTPWAIPATGHSRLLWSRDEASGCFDPRLSIRCQIPARSTEHCQPGPEAGLGNALMTAPAYTVHEGNKQAARGKHHHPPSQLGSNKKAENSFFFFFYHQG